MNYTKPKKFLTINVKLFSVLMNCQDKEFDTKTIIDMVVNAFPDTPRNSIIPSDYCYNLINKGSSSFKFCFFEFLERGSYKFLGADYPYSGPIYWKGGKVGEWKQGEYYLTRDPRE